MRYHVLYDFQDHGSRFVMAQLESACLLPSSTTHPSFAPLYERLQLALRESQPLKEGLIKACVARLLTHLLVERPRVQDARGEVTAFSAWKMIFAKCSQAQADAIYSDAMSSCGVALCGRQERASARG